MKKAILLGILFLVPAGLRAAEGAGNVGGVRACLFVPGVSVPASVPDNLPNEPQPSPRPEIKSSKGAVDAAVTARQLEMEHGLWNAVFDHYVYPDFRGKDWKAIGSKYEALIKEGLSEKDFYAAMENMVRDLGDDHSYFQSPAKVEEEKKKLASQYNFVGIGTLLVPTPEHDAAYIISVFRGGPAAAAGLQTHDVIRKVDGGPVRQENGLSRTLGQEGSRVKLTVQRPGEAARDMTMTRRRVAGALPIDYCIVPTTRIGYLFLPTLLDKTMPEQVRLALKKMTAAGPLDGLILDNRMNGGGSGQVTEAILGMFASGTQGNFISREGKTPLQLKAENIGGSQSVPMVVLVSPHTVSYGEIMSGVLRLAGRAKLAGQTTKGNVEQLKVYTLADGSHAWIASASYAPPGQASGIWEGKGIVPDVTTPTRWDYFTEANDPGLAKALELLKKK